MIIYEEIFKAFQKQKVKYVLVGGIAVNLLGAMCSTADLDILVDMRDENIKKVVNILKKRGYRVKQPIDPLKLADEKIRKDWIKNKHMKAFNFYKEGQLQEVDIIIDSPVSYKQAQGDIVSIKIDSLTLPVISINKLIKMKRKTARAVDKLDIKELNKIKRLKRKI